MESREFGSAQQTVEDVPHLVEESDNIVMPHDCGLIRCRLCKVSNHRSERVLP